jgi:nicotinate-nucleotide adenylyltransferase
MKTRMAVFGGSFDPPTKAHVEIVKRIMDQQLAEMVMVAPAAGHRTKQNTLSWEDRYLMVDLALPKNPHGSEDSPYCFPSSADKLSCERYEEGLGSTWNLMQAAEDLHGEELEYVVVVGGDCLDEVRNWYRGEELLQKYSFILAPRLGNPRLSSEWDPMLKSGRLRIIEGTPLVGSSTEVRNAVARGESISNTPIASGVEDFVKNGGFYA